MKIYKVTLDLTFVLPRLKEIDLKEFNSQRPIIFVDANDPDDACSTAHYKFVSLIISQKPKMAKIMKDLLFDVRIIKVRVAE